MADKTFHSIKFPGLPDTYKIPDIVNEYSTSSAYAVGDYALKDGKTYKCTNAIASSGEAWNTAHWTEVKVGNDLQGEVADLKSVFDGLESDLKGESEDEIAFVYDYYINVRDGSTVNTNSPVSDNRYKYAIVDCSEGDKFLINAYGGNAPRAYCFIDSNNSKLRVSDADTNIINQTIVAPPNSAKLIINDRYSESGDLSSYKIIGNGSEIGDLFVRFDKEQNKTEEEKAIARENIGVVDGLSDEAKEALLACFRNVAWLNWEENNESYYDKLAEALGVDPSDVPSINKLIMEIGNINASTGDDDDSTTLRIRSTNYLPVTSSTITVSGCPFSDTWYNYSNDGRIIAALIAARCYNSSKQYLSSVNFIPDGVFNGTQSLPSGTAYVRFIIQKNEAYSYAPGFSDSAVYPLVIDGVEYYIKEA